MEMKKSATTPSGKRKNIAVATLFLAAVLMYLLIAVQYKISRVPEDKKDFYTDEQGRIYPQGADTYLFYRQALDLSEGKEVHTLSLLPHAEYYVYRIGRIFDSNFSINDAIFYLPLILGLISLVLVFLIARVSIGEKAAVAASFLFSFHPIILEVFHVSYGDDEPLVTMLSLLFIFLLFKTILSLEEKSRKKAAIFGVLSVLSIILFKKSWEGYYYILIITAAFFIIYLLVKLYQKKQYKKIFALIIAIALASLLSSVFLSGQIESTKIYSRLLPAEISEGYPDWTLQIQELKPATLKNIYAFMGGWPFVLVVLAGIASFLAKNKLFTSENKESALQLYLFVYFIAAFAGTLMAKRAETFLGLIIIIVASAGVAWLAEIFPKIIAKAAGKKIKNAEIIITAAIIIILAACLAPTSIKYVNDPPLMEDSVYVTAQKISQYSEPDAIVTSWWDEGHFYYAFSGRNVTIKGHPDPRMMYILSKALATNDENLSAGMLKLLNCGRINDSLLKANIYSAINKNNCTPKQQFLVLSSWAEKYAPIIYLLGNWNFSAQKTDFDSSFAPIGSVEKCRAYSSSVLECGKMYTLDMEKMEAMYDGRQISLVYQKNSSFVFKDRKSNYVLVLYKPDESYNAVAVRKDIIGTMFIRLYFLDGAGLSHFNKFSDISAIKRTVAYEIKYD